MAGDVDGSLDYADLGVWWGEYAQCYQDRSWKDYRALLAELIRSAPGGPLLDIGCGYGFLVECARRFGIEAIGLEASEHALAEARRFHPAADIRAWDAGCEMDIGTGEIGMPIANEFIDHVSLEQNEGVMKELRRVLAPGGILLVKSPAKDNRFDQDKGHITFFSPSEFRDFVTSFGLEVVEQPYIPQPLLGQSRLGWLAMRLLAKLHHPERWAARIDLVARKPS